MTFLLNSSDSINSISYDENFSTKSKRRAHRRTTDRKIHHRRFRRAYNKMSNKTCSFHSKDGVVVVHISKAERSEAAKVIAKKYEDHRKPLLWNLLNKSILFVNIKGETNPKTELAQKLVKRERIEFLTEIEDEAFYESYERFLATLTDDWDDESEEIRAFQKEYELLLCYEQRDIQNNSGNDDITPFVQNHDYHIEFHH